MPIPRSNVEEILRQGPVGVYMGLMAAKSALGEAFVAYFLDLVPERGGELWTRFTGFRDSGGDDFIAFIKSVVTQSQTRLFFPKNCILDPLTRELLVPDIQKAVQDTGIKKNEDVLRVFYAEGAPYAAARNISCRGCPNRNCEHWLSFNGRARR